MNRLSSISLKPSASTSRISVALSSRTCSSMRGFQRCVHGAQHRLWIFEVMIHIGQKRDIDRRGGNRHILWRVDNTGDVGETLLLHVRHGVVDEGFGDIDGIDLAAGAHCIRKQPREQSGAGTDVSDRHAGLDLRRGDNLVALVEHLAPFFMEGVGPRLERAVEKRLVDAGSDAFVLRESGARKTRHANHQRPRQPRISKTFRCNHAVLPRERFSVYLVARTALRPGIRYAPSGLQAAHFYETPYFFSAA